MTHSQSDSSNGSSTVTLPEQQVADRPHATVPVPPPKRPWQKIPKPVRIIGAIGLVAGLGFGLYRLFFYQPKPDGLFLSGRIEGYETDVSAKIGGRVASVNVREGDAVQPNQLLLQIDDADTQAQLQGAQARLQQQRENLQRTRQQLPVLQAQLQQAQLTTQQSTQESQGQIFAAENVVAQARADLAEAEANLFKAESTQRRTSQLYAEGAVSAQELDNDTANLTSAQAQVEARQQAVRSSQGQLTQAQATQKNTPIRTAYELQLQRQIDQAETDIAIAEQQVQDAEATVAQYQANLDYLTIHSPMTGDVITRSVEPGEVVAAGAPLLTLVNQNQLYLRGFVPAGEIGHVAIGQSALVYLDTFPDQPLQATVSRIDPKASFTPENTYFKDDRVTQVFGVELTLNDNTERQAKPGMPADGRILLPEDEPNPSVRQSHRPNNHNIGLLPFPTFSPTISLLLPTTLLAPHL